MKDLSRLTEEGGDTRYSPPPARVTVPLYPVPPRSCVFGRALATYAGRSDRLVHAARVALADVLGVPAEDILLTASGTQALIVALRHLRHGATDEVIIPAFACPSLIAAVLAADMVPVLCDVSDNWTMDADQVTPLLGSRTRAVVAAHIFGASAALEGLQALCDGDRVHLIDDAAQALGGNVQGRALGTWGTFGVLSFGRHKPVFAGGGGALVRGRTAPAALRPGPDLPSYDGGVGWTGLVRPLVVDALRRADSRLPVWLGLQSRPAADVRAPLETYAVSTGGTSGISPVGAALLLDQLAQLGRHRARMRSLASQYVGATGYALQPPPASVLSGELNFFPFRCAPGRRHAIASRFAEAGVETTWLYFPLHRVQQYRGRFRAGDLSVSDRLWKEILCVPGRGWHRTRDVDRVAQVISVVNAAVRA